MEKKILSAAISSRDNYNKLLPILEEADLSDIPKEIWKRIVEFYERDKWAKEVDVDILKGQITREMNKPDLPLRLLSNLGEVSSSNLMKELSLTKRRRIAHEWAGVLLASYENEKKVLDYVDKYKSCGIEDTKPTEEILSGATAAAFLTEDSTGTERIKLYPQSLNEATEGGAYKGGHIIVFARPETGKTQFLINLSRGLIKDGRRVLYIANEEPKVQLIHRLLSRITGKVRGEISDNVASAVEEARQVGLDNFYLDDLNPGTIPEIHGLIEKIRPDVLIVDQIRNLKVGEVGLVNILEKAAMEVRNLAKEFDMLAISVTQAGDSATNKLVLGMSDVDNSKTGLPAAADLMIGIGLNEEFRSQSMRMLSLCKNKISGNHSYFPVSVDERLSKITSL